MSRGKYQTRSEATHARVEAESEVVAGRRKIMQLTNENEELRRTLATEREANSDRERRVVALMNDGASPELEAARLRIASLTERVQRATHDAAVKMFKFTAGRRDFKGSIEFQLDLLQHMGLDPIEVYPGWDTDPREIRRRTVKKARAAAGEIKQFKGHPTVPGRTVIRGTS